MKKIAIVQSNYIPWKGYFDLIAYVDEFILLDDVQFTKRDWRNRNYIKSPDGITRLTVPTLSKKSVQQKIFETQIHRTDWADSHWKTIERNCKRSDYFFEVAKWLQPIYLDEKHIHLSELNQRLIREICNYLCIGTPITNSRDYVSTDGQTERLAHLCLQTNATEYVSGPSAKTYIDKKIFTDKGIEISWFDYSNYPEYPQLWGKFIHNVSILDLLFNCGKESRRYMKFVS